MVHRQSNSRNSQLTVGGYTDPSAISTNAIAKISVLVAYYANTNRILSASWIVATAEPSYHGGISQSSGLGPDPKTVRHHGLLKVNAQLAITTIQCGPFVRRCVLKFCAPVLR